MDKVNLDELGVKSKVEQEMIRLNRFKTMLGEKENHRFFGDFLFMHLSRLT